MEERTYIAIDLKSFYASVECRELGLDPLKTNLVVADRSRTEKTICLAVSPSLRALGIPGRARLFEVIQAVQKINALRRMKAPGHAFDGKSTDAMELEQHPEKELDFITAVPRMAYYMEYSTRIYSIYLKYAAPEDIHVYSIDEVMVDVTAYLKASGLTAREYARKMIREVLETTGITATAGIGTNLYLCKIAMDIVAKHIPPDEDGVRIAELDEMSYRRTLWGHRPITDFWRVGKGTARKLASHGMHTMGDVARCSVGGESDPWNEELLYKLFGVNAELLIDHAWGWESCGMKHIKDFKPESSSITAGQVLSEPYPKDKARTIIREMADGLAMELAAKGLVSDQVTLTIGYDSGSLASGYDGETETDWYGRKMPKMSRGSENIGRMTASARLIIEAAVRLYDRIAAEDLQVRRMYIAAVHTQSAEEARPAFEQMDMFSLLEGEDRRERERAELAREAKMQEAVLNLRQRFGKNAVLRGTSYQEEATGRERNHQIGGHKA